MKKIICLFLAVLLCFTLIGCKPKEPAVPDTPDPDTGTAITPDAAEVIYNTEKIVIDNEYAIFTIKSIEKDNFFECYQLVNADLATAVGDNIYKFKFCYRGGTNLNDGYLINTPGGLFLFAGEKQEFAFVTLADQTIIDEMDEEEKEEIDDLDFCMF